MNTLDKRIFHAGLVVLLAASMLAAFLGFIQYKLNVISYFDKLALPVLTLFLSVSFLGLIFIPKESSSNISLPFKIAYCAASIYFQLSWINCMWFIESNNRDYSILVLACAFPLMYCTAYFVSSKHHLKLAILNYCVFLASAAPALFLNTKLSTLNVQVVFAVILSGPIHWIFTLQVKRQSEITKNLLEEHDVLRNKVYKDQLTQAFTRDFFVSQYKKIESLKNCAVMMVDADYFKRINDTYGHIVGDNVLVSLASTLQKTVAEQGEVYRWGGEEFLIVLKNVKSKDSLKELAALLNVEVPVRSLEVSGIKCTVSIGASIKNKQSLEDVIRRADQLAYQAKKSGRNCHCIED